MSHEWLYLQGTKSQGIIYGNSNYICYLFSALSLIHIGRCLTVGNPFQGMLFFVAMGLSLGPPNNKPSLPYLFVRPSTFHAPIVPAKLFRCTPFFMNSVLPKTSQPYFIVITKVPSSAPMTLTPILAWNTSIYAWGGASILCKEEYRARPGQRKDWALVELRSEFGTRISASERPRLPNTDTANTVHVYEFFSISSSFSLSFLPAFDTPVVTIHL